MTFKELAKKYKTKITVTYGTDGTVSVASTETGLITFANEFVNIEENVDATLNTIALDKLMDETSEADDFHKRKY